MELRQLEYFREIASTGSINEAARHLNMSQPPLSYQIRQLENELNVKLFDRTSKGVTLTEAGKLLYDRSGNLLEYARSTELEVSKTGKKRILRIGLTPTTVDTIMPYISQFSRVSVENLSKSAAFKMSASSDLVVCSLAKAWPSQDQPFWLFLIFSNNGLKLWLKPAS